MLTRFYCWRCFKKDDTAEIVYARSMSQAREKYAQAHNLTLREVEAELA